MITMYMYTDDDNVHVLVVSEIKVHQIMMLEMNIEINLGYHTHVYMYYSQFYDISDKTISVIKYKIQFLSCNLLEILVCH